MSENDTLYKGNFENDQKHGFGTLTIKNEKFSGSWVNNKLNQGKITYSDGSSYTGKLENFQRVGMGEIRDIDGRLVFCGEFKNGDKFSGD